MKTEKQYKELTIKEFTKATDVYESEHAGIYEICKEDYPYISSELEKEEYHDLLDCGCGTGPMISLLYEKDPSKHYTGLDLTPRMIEVGKAKNLEGVDWIVGDCENLPFDENTFDGMEKIEAKPFNRDFEVQSDAACELYHRTIKFSGKKELLSKWKEIRETYETCSNMLKKDKIKTSGCMEKSMPQVLDRVEEVLREQIRKYGV